MQEILAQADAKLKRAKGKAWMPQLRKEEVVDLFTDLRRDEEGLLSFHDIQNTIMKWRVNRIAENKILFPSVNSTRRVKATLSENTKPEINQYTSLKKYQKTVSSKVAPPTMFLKNKGLRDGEIPDLNNKLLSTRAFMIAEMSNSGTTDVLSNVRLLRPTRHNPNWDGLAGFKHTSVPSRVKTARSSTSPQRTTTLL